MTNKPNQLTKVRISIDNDYLVINKGVGRNAYHFAIAKEIFTDAEYGAVVKTLDPAYKNSVNLYDDVGGNCIAINDVRVKLDEETRNKLRLQVEHINNDPGVADPHPAFLEQSAERRGE